MTIRIARWYTFGLSLVFLFLIAACGPEVRINTYIESLSKAGSLNPKRDLSKEPMYAGHEALVEKLVAIGQPAVEPLLAALQNPVNGQQFAYVASALGKLAEPRAYTPIYNKLMAGSRSWVLFEALLAIDPTDPRNEQAILLMDTPYTKIALEYLLSNGIQSQEVWINSLVTPGSRNRKDKLELLQQIGGLPAAQVIAAYLSTTSEAELLQPALDAFSSMLTDPAVLPAVDAILPRLIELLDHKDKSIRTSTVELLAATSEPAALDALAARASTQADQKTDWDERLLVLRALVQANDPRAGEALWETVLGEQFIRTDTMKALVELFDQTGAYDQERLLTALDTGSGIPHTNAAIALAISDDPAVLPALRKISADQAEDIDIRRAAIQGLSRLGGNAAVPNLAGLLNDPAGYFVVEEAVAQLTQIGSSEAIAALTSRMQRPPGSRS